MNNKIQNSYNEAFDDFQNHLMIFAFRTSIAMIIIEILFFTYYYFIGIEGMTAAEYLLFYLIRPTLINTIAWIIGYFLEKNSKIPKRIKLSIPLVIFLIISANCAATHNAFPILYGLIVFPIYASTIYADKKILKNMTILAIILELIVTIIIYSDPYSTRPTQLGFNIILTFFCIIMTYFVSSSIILHEKRKEQILQKNVEYNKQLEDELLIDGLTGLYNYRGLLNFTKSNVSNNNKMQMAILDLDNFKSINDTYGHEVGNVVLKKLAELLKELQSENTKVARYGGEEFAVLFLNQKIEDSYKELDEIRKKLEIINFEDIPDKSITFSAGISSYNKTMNIREFFETADKLLYEAKINGKNQVVKE